MSLGDVAPSFALESDEGQVVHLHDFWGRPVVLFFYPGDFTSVCTKEGTFNHNSALFLLLLAHSLPLVPAEHFRDSIDAFNAKGAVVLGVSKGACTCLCASSCPALTSLGALPLLPLALLCR